MMIGRENRYLFVEIPNTGSTAISRELRNYYGGERILHKHATYGEFLKTPEGRSGRYFVFSSVRHPLDAAVTAFFKLKTNHGGRFTSERFRNTPSVTPRHKDLFGFIQDGGEFPGFFRKFQPNVYNNYYLLLHKQFDYVMRYERLQEDFAEVLRRLGIEQVQPIPLFNRTGQKSSDFWSYYTPDIREQAMRLYWPYMRRWGYEFPPEWGKPRIEALAEFKFSSTRVLANLVNRTAGLGPNSRKPWAIQCREVVRRWWS